MKIKIVNTSNNPLPSYETASSAGMDLRANLTETVVVEPNKRCLIPTGLKISLPVGYEAQLRPRSGLALKKGITLTNSPGTIDADYRGEIGVIIHNTGEHQFEIHNGDRIAQMVINKVEQAQWIVQSSLDETERGDGGFGHTGAK